LEAFRSSSEAINEYLATLKPGYTLVQYGSIYRWKMVTNEEAPSVKFTFDTMWLKQPIVATAHPDIMAAAHLVADKLTFLTVGGNAIEVGMSMDGRAQMRGGLEHSRAIVDGRRVLCETKRTALLKSIRRRLLITARKLVARWYYMERRPTKCQFVIKHATAGDAKRKAKDHGKPKTKRAKQAKDE
jgi:hypothetical protein